MLVIQRKEIQELRETPGWLLVFGRRKVGKTFLVKNYLAWDAYFLVRRDMAIIGEGPGISSVDNAELFVEQVKRLLREGKKVVVDEFQRLPESFLDEIASVHPSGRLILTGSSLRVVHRVLSSSSPILGLVAEKRLDLISPRDAFISLAKKFSPQKALLLAPYARDPWILEHLRDLEPVRAIYEVLRGAKHSIPALVGEVFQEEERQLTATYEAILRLVGSGRWRANEVASTLYGRGLLKHADPRGVAPYISYMAEMDLIESVEIHRSKANYLKLKSPIMEAFYYLADRYSFDDADVQLSEVRPTLERLLAMHVQDFVAQLLAELRGGRRAYYFTPTQELDFLITVRGKPQVAGEVKLGRVTLKDIKKFLDAAAAFAGIEKILVCQRHLTYPGVTILTPEELLELSKEGQG